MRQPATIPDVPRETSAPGEPGENSGCAPNLKAACVAVDGRTLDRPVAQRRFGTHYRGRARMGTGNGQIGTGRPCFAAYDASGIDELAPVVDKDPHVPVFIVMACRRPRALFR